MSREQQSTTRVDLSQEIGKQVLETMDQMQERTIPGELIRISSMKDLAPDLPWNGLISQNDEEIALEAVQSEEYKKLVLRSVETTSSGGQEGCMDGRPSGVDLLLGPKTAGGTSSDAKKIVIASLAYDPIHPISYEEAFNQVTTTLQRLGFIPGGHELGQCGAEKLFDPSMSLVTERSSTVKSGVSVFLDALNVSYDDLSQGKVMNAVRLLQEQRAHDIPGSDKLAKMMRETNEESCPTLRGKHLEHDMVVFEDTDYTLNSNSLSFLAVNSNILPGERHAFSYNWGLHKEIAKDLQGELGRLYLHSVPTLDIPTLSGLTDGSLGIFAYSSR